MARQTRGFLVRWREFMVWCDERGWEIMNLPPNAGPYLEARWRAVIAETPCIVMLYTQGEKKSEEHGRVHITGVPPGEPTLRLMKALHRDLRDTDILAFKFR